MNKGLAQSGSGVYISPVVPLSQLTVTSLNAPVSFTHNLGTPHLDIHWKLVNLLPEKGFSAGDEVEYPPGTNWDNPAQAGMLVQGVAALFLFDKGKVTGGNVTVAKWGIRVRIQALLP